MDWKALELRLTETAVATLDTLLATEPGPLYGAAFFASYREAEQVMDMPSLAANTRLALDEDHPARADSGFWSVTWNPADWRWQWEPSDYGGDALAGLNDALQAHATRGTPAQWDAAEKKFMSTVARAAAAVRKHFANDARVDRHFVVFFHDESGGPALARTSMSARLFLRHFPEQDEATQKRLQLAALSEAEQAAYYVSRLAAVEGIDGEEASAWLIAHGASALPLLLALLETGADAWQAAMILGLAGVADPEAIHALRRHASSDDESLRDWSSRALGYLGDVDWLLAQPPVVAMAGCCAPLAGFRDDGARPAVLDYVPLERLLAWHPGIEPDVEALLAPGSDFCTIHAADVPEAIRGLQSSHRVIRRHAACVMNDRKLGKKAIATAVTALQGAADDADEQVRYLVGVALENLAR